MSDGIKLYEIAASPNNIKVRIALNYKELPFERIPVPVKGYPPNPEDRAEVVKVSGQPLTPVVVHGDRVVFDSAAILRYLEGSFRRTRPLFSSDFRTMKEIENWERFGRTDLVGPIDIIFGLALSGKKDHLELVRASGNFHDLTGRIEKQLQRSPWLVGDRMTAADVTAAPIALLGMLPPEPTESNPIREFFAENLQMGEGREKTRAWVGKVMAYER